jgi:predicted GNAT family acetyltransferase
VLHRACIAQAIPPACGLASAPSPKIGSRPALGPSPREHDEEIILSEGHRNDAVEEKVEVRDNPFEGRYEIRLDGRTAGFTAYESKPNLIAFLHTEIDPSLEGRGLGSRLVGSALDDAREHGLEVLPFCPFVNAFIRRHRDEYVELVPEGFRQGFGL